MTAKERVSTIRLLEKVNRQPEYAKQIGLIVEMKRRKITTQKITCLNKERQTKNSRIKLYKNSVKLLNELIKNEEVF